MINENTLIGEIQRRFPTFQINPEFEDVPTVIAGDLVDFITANMKDNELLVKETANFLNDAVESADAEATIASFLFEVVLGFYDLSDKSTYDFIRSRVAPNTQQYFDYAISLWQKGNSKTQ
jgi:hypothetical protein